MCQYLCKKGCITDSVPLCDDCLRRVPLQTTADSVKGNAFSLFSQNSVTCIAADGIDQDGADILQHALATERKLRDRNSQLSVPNKSFARVRAICEQQLQQMSGAMQRATPSRPPGSSAKVRLASAAADTFSVVH